MSAREHTHLPESTRPRRAPPTAPRSPIPDAHEACAPRASPSPSLAPHPARPLRLTPLAPLAPRALRLTPLAFSPPTQSARRAAGSGSARRAAGSVRRSADAPDEDDAHRPSRFLAALDSAAAPTPHTAEPSAPAAMPAAAVSSFAAIGRTRPPAAGGGHDEGSGSRASDRDRARPSPRALAGARANLSIEPSATPTAAAAHARRASVSSGGASREQSASPSLRELQRELDSLKSSLSVYLGSGLS